MELTAKEKKEIKEGIITGKIKRISEVWAYTGQGYRAELFWAEIMSTTSQFVGKVFLDPVNLKNKHSSALSEYFDVPYQYIDVLILEDRLELAKAVRDKLKKSPDSKR